MTTRVAAAVRIAAQFAFLSLVLNAKKKRKRAREVRVCLLASLTALQYPLRRLDATIRNRFFTRLAAHVNVHYGIDAGCCLQFWWHFQVLGSYLRASGANWTVRLAAKQDILAPFLQAAEEVGLAAELHKQTAAFEVALASRLPKNEGVFPAALGALDDAHAIAARHFEQTCEIGHGPSTLPGISYEEAYRLAFYSGRLQMLVKGEPLIQQNKNGVMLRRHELLLVIERLGLTDSIPRDVVDVRMMLGKLRTPSAAVWGDRLSDLFLWLRTYLETMGRSRGRSDLRHWLQNRVRLLPAY